MPLVLGSGAAFGTITLVHCTVLWHASITYSTANCRLRMLQCHTVTTQLIRIHVQARKEAYAWNRSRVEAWEGGGTACLI